MVGGNYVVHYNFLFKTIHFKLLTMSGMWQVLNNCELSNWPCACSLWTIWTSREGVIWGEMLSTLRSTPSELLSVATHRNSRKERSPWPWKLYLGFHRDHILSVSTPSSRSGKNPRHSSSIWMLALHCASLEASEFLLYLKHLLWFTSIVKFQMTLEYT